MTDTCPECGCEPWDGYCGPIYYKAYTPMLQTAHYGRCTTQSKELPCL